MRIAVISTYTHPTRLPIKEPSVMQCSAPELIAGLCPKDCDVELYNEKEVEIPLDRNWDIVFFSYLHSHYEHTKILSTLFRRKGITTVAGGRHTVHFATDCQKYFDSVVTGEPESNIPLLISDFKRGRLKGLYNLPSSGMESINPNRYDLIDYRSNRRRMPAIEASRGCPFSCNFCVLSGNEKYRVRPIKAVVKEILQKMQWNRHNFGLLEDCFMFVDNNLGGSPDYLRELCEELVPLHKWWGCSVSFNILRDPEMIKLLSKAGCRYVYTGLESLNPDSLGAMQKGQNKLKEVAHVIHRCHDQGILLSFGLLIGSDGDTNEYLDMLPRLLSDLNYFSVTFVGMLCPYPETPLYRALMRAGRILPGTISRDYDGYTLCHKPKQLDPTEVVDHFIRLCTELSEFSRIFRHCRSKLGLSDLPKYRLTVLGSGKEIRSLRAPVRNQKRRYIAGLDHIEEWDAKWRRKLQLEVQSFS